MWFYRKDAKGGAAHSVRDRLTAPLAKRMRTANIQLGTARERSDRTRNGQLRLCRSTSRTLLHAARNGHISTSRQRALTRPLGAFCPMCRMCPMCPITRPSLVPCALRARAHLVSFVPLSLRFARGRIRSLLAPQRSSPVRATRLQPGVSVALPPVIQARVSVYRASSARPATLRGRVALNSSFIICSAAPLLR